MGLPYKLRGVDLLKGAENDPEFMAVNPAGYIPALTDGDTTMVESIAIMEYLLARHGHASQAQTPLALPPADPNFGLYQQFLHLGEAGLAMPTYMQVITRNIAPEADRDNWTARKPSISSAAACASSPPSSQRRPTSPAPTSPPPTSPSPTPSTSRTTQAASP